MGVSGAGPSPGGTPTRRGFSLPPRFIRSDAAYQLTNLRAQLPKTRIPRRSCITARTRVGATKSPDPLPARLSTGTPQLYWGMSIGTIGLWELLPGLLQRLGCGTPLPAERLSP